MNPHIGGSSNTRHDQEATAQSPEVGVATP